MIDGSLAKKGFQLGRGPTSSWSRPQLAMDLTRSWLAWGTRNHVEPGTGWHGTLSCLAHLEGTKKIDISDLFLAVANINNNLHDSTFFYSYYPFPTPKPISHSSQLKRRAGFIKKGPVTTLPWISNVLVPLFLIEDTFFRARRCFFLLLLHWISIALSLWIVHSTWVQKIFLLKRFYVNHSRYKS